jgi:hypothetical protein
MELQRRVKAAEGGESFRELRHLRKKCIQLEEDKEQLLRKVRRVR